MTQQIHRKVSFKSPLFSNRSLKAPEEKAESIASNQALFKRTWEIFNQIAPTLMSDHYGWSIMIEPESGEYFIGADPQIAFEQGKTKYPYAIFWEMRLTHEGTCGKI